MFWHVRPLRTKINLRIRAVWLESPLSTWRNSASMAIQNVHSQDSNQTVRTHRLNEYSSLGAHVWRYVFWRCCCFVCVCVCVCVCVVSRILSSKFIWNVTLVHLWENMCVRKYVYVYCETWFCRQNNVPVSNLTELTTNITAKELDFLSLFSNWCFATVVFTIRLSKNICCPFKTWSFPS